MKWHNLDYNHMKSSFNDFFTYCPILKIHFLFCEMWIVLCIYKNTSLFLCVLYVKTSLTIFRPCRFEKKCTKNIMYKMHKNAQNKMHKTHIDIFVKIELKISLIVHDNNSESWINLTTVKCLFLGLQLTDNYSQNYLNNLFSIL